MEPDINEVLFNGLNEQGFLLQEKCSQSIIDTSNSTKWVVNTTEHPVSLKDLDTRIDIVIREEGLVNSSKFGAIECKRVNPLYNCWLFGTPLYEKPVHASGTFLKLVAETNYNTYKVIPVRHDFDVYTHIVGNWWIQVNLSEKNNQKKSDPQPIENAFFQVCLGVGGLLSERIRQISKTIRDGNKEFYDMSVTFFIPIIITTSPLYVTKYDLSDVDISTGKIEKDKLSFIGLPNSSESVKWVLVDYGASAKTAPDMVFKNYHGVDPVDLEFFNKRSIFVVNSCYLTDFLAQLHSLNGK